MPFFASDPSIYLIRLIVLFAVLPIHECAHAFASDKLGDPTARRLGRLTINPFAHLDLMGSVCILLTGIGWAKPVPVNAMYFRNRKWGMALSALAGPVSNLLMGWVLLAIAQTILCIYFTGGAVAGALYTLYQVLVTMVQISVSLAVFNLLPVPPLDGSRILLLFLPERLYFKLMRYEQYVSIALFALLFFGVLDGPLRFLTNACLDLLVTLTGWIPTLFGF